MNFSSILEMEANTTIAKLIEIGLTEREAKVYRVLLNVTDITAAAIPKFTDIPRTKVYEAITSLVRKGFCKEVPSAGGLQNSQTFAAISPDIAISGMMNLEKSRMRHLEALSSDLTQELLQVYTRSTDRLQDYDFIEILRGRQEIVARYSKHRKEAREEILELSPEGFAMTEEEANEEADQNEELIKRGVQIKVIYEAHEIRSGANTYFHRKNKEVGVEARMLERLPIRLSLFDKTTVMLPLSDPMMDTPNLTVLIIEHRNLYQILYDAFTNNWEKATPIDAK